MTSLLDIGPLTEEVEIRGTKLTVQGLSGGDLFQLMSFPEFRSAMESKAQNPQTILQQLGPQILAKVIAICTGTPNNPEAEAKAAQLGASDQMTLIKVVTRLSFPDGIGPFVHDLRALMGEVVTDIEQNGKGSDLKLPLPFGASLQTDSPGMLPGRRPRAN
jgi:hypothetical protein